MGILETVGVFVGGPAVIYGGIAVLTLIPGRGKRQQRYRPGRPWDVAPQWWAGDHPVAPTDPLLTAAGTEGGARGNW